MPLALIATAFLLTVVGNRWGSYLVTPVPGLFLADLLLLLGAVSGIVVYFRSVRLHRWVMLTYGIVALYLLLVLGLELLRVPESDRYFALRDDAPFIYLVLVPALALSLRAVGARPVVYFVRVATAAAVIGPLLVHVGLLQSTPSVLLGSEHVELFGYRTDLTGAVAAIGIVAWSGWDGLRIKANLPVQLGYVFAAGLVVLSRSGLIAVVVGILVLAWLQRGWTRRGLVGAAGLVIFLAGLLVAPAAVLPAESPDASTVSASGAPAAESTTPGSATATPAPSDEVVDEVTPTVDEAEQRTLWGQIGRVGTVAARLDTWNDVVTGLAADGTWLVGGAAGSDYLYELCTGITEAPTVLLYPNSGPKCSVDDYGSEPVVRDPHNWILNIAVTHGILGVLIFAGALGVTLVKGRHSAIFRLSAWTIGFFLISGLTFLISGGYALVPMAVAAAWIVSRAGLVTRPS